MSFLRKWRLAASAALLGLYLIPSIFAEFIFQIFRTNWGHIFSLAALIKNVTDGLFGAFAQSAREVTNLDGGVAHEILVTEPPLWVNWLALFVLCALCLALLSRKVKAYEVVN